MKTYRIDKNTILSIEDTAINKMMKYCQRQGMNEGGGILLGKVKNDYTEFIITDISEPCKRDRSGKYYFVRNKDSAQEIINKVWRLSEGEVNYIGEWHTHPEINPTPSFVDKKLLDECVEENQYAFNCLFLIIVGMEGEMYVGYKAKKMKKMRQLQVIYD